MASLPASSRESEPTVSASVMCHESDSHGSSEAIPLPLELGSRNSSVVFIEGRGGSRFNGLGEMLNF